jgi:hypothetical protein
MPQYKTPVRCEVLERASDLVGFSEYLAPVTECNSSTHERVSIFI